MNFREFILHENFPVSLSTPLGNLNTTQAVGGTPNTVPNTNRPDYNDNTKNVLDFPLGQPLVKSGIISTVETRNRSKGGINKGGTPVIITLDNNVMLKIPYDIYYKRKNLFVPNKKITATLQKNMNGEYETQSITVH